MFNFNHDNNKAEIIHYEAISNEIKDNDSAFELRSCVVISEKSIITV